MGEHDLGYKELFSHPRMIEDLLRGFVRQDWLAQVDFASLERVNATYISKRMRQREDDMVWRLRLKTHWLYIYILLEFQSSIDRFMAVRMLSYLSLFYEDLLKREKNIKLLPPVLPLVLYNGKKRWDAQTEVSRLVEIAAGRLKDYQVNFRYLIIDEGAFSESQVIKERNLAGLLFRLEQSQNPKEMEEAVKLLIEWLADEKGSELYRSFIAWFQRVFIALRYPDVKFTPPQDLQEVRNMLAERVLDWKEDWKREGLQEGLQEGVKKGLQEGVKKGLQEGVKKGLQEGLQEGALNASQEAIKVVLSSRFGQFSPQVTDYLKKVDDPFVLKTLIQQAATTPSLDAFLKHVASNS